MTEDNDRADAVSMPGITTSAGIYSDDDRRPKGVRDSVARRPRWVRIVAGLTIALVNACAAIMILIPALASLTPSESAKIFSIPIIGAFFYGVWVLVWLLSVLPRLVVMMLILHGLAYALQWLAKGRLPMLAQLLLHLLTVSLVAPLVADFFEYLPPQDLTTTAFFTWSLAAALATGCILELLLYLTVSPSSTGAPTAAASGPIHSAARKAKRKLFPAKLKPWAIGAVAGVGLVIIGLTSGPWRDVWTALPGPKYEVVDSGVRTSIDEIYWLDNRRVIFSGIRAPKPETVEEKWTSQVEILIWDTETNTIEPYRDIPRGLFCYADGRVFYDLRKEEPPGMKNPVRIFMAGPLGEETKHEFAIDRALNDRYRFNMLSCRHVKRPEVVPPGGGWMPLKAEHGFLRFVPAKEHYYMDVIFNNDSESIRLPFNDEETWPTIAEWYALHGGYFMYEPATSIKERSRWQETNCLRAWWLYPSGETETTCVPAGVWAKYGADFIAPIEGGFVFSVLTQPRDVRGLHVSIDGESRRIIGGLTEKPVVSPNGCRVAFAHAPSYTALRPGGEGRRTLKMVDVCDESLNHKHQ